MPDDAPAGDAELAAPDPAGEREAEQEPAQEPESGSTPASEPAQEPEPESTREDREEATPAVESAVVGEELSVSYTTSDEPVVECGRIDVPEGEITALVGPNGSGKSTLLKALANQLAPDAGTVLVDGRELRSFGTKELARTLGLLSQENESPSSLTVEELAYHGRYPYRGFFDAADEADDAAVEEALELAGVADIRHAEMGSLSGGQKQLAWIAMVLAQETDVLLLDEPTTFLDLRHQLHVLEVVRELNRERDLTVAVVLHDVGQAARFADNLIALRDGEPYDWGPPREVVTEQLLADVFGVEATVEAGAAGPNVDPHRPL